MAGGLVKYRHLSRHSSARQALLRGLVTQLVQYEHIHTTYAKAKEAQRLAEKLITLAKRDNGTATRHAQGILYTPHLLLPKVLGELKNRYQSRDRGYTRVTKTEPKNPYDQGESAILEFVDGPRDSRFMITAKAIARDQRLGRESTPLTIHNMKKVTRYRGEEDFQEMVARFKEFDAEDTEASEEVDESPVDNSLATPKKSDALTSKEQAFLSGMEQNMGDISSKNSARR